MHELSLCVNLIEQIEEIGNDNQLTHIEKVYVEYGPLSGIEKQALEFAFPEAIRSSNLLKNSELMINEVALQIFCHSCQTSHSLEDVVIYCPNCFDTTNIEITQGKDFQLTRLEGK